MRSCLPAKTLKGAICPGPDDFGELQSACDAEASGQGCGCRLRFPIDTQLSNKNKTFVVKNMHSDGGGTSGIVRGAKFNSTCCRVHQNADLVPDSARIHMYVQTTKVVLVGCECYVND